jgi:hypothetical protein
VALSIAALAGVLYLGSGWLQGIGNWNLVSFFALLLGTGVLLGVPIRVLLRPRRRSPSCCA